MGAILSNSGYMWFCCMVGAACMMLNGYDSSTFNAVQGSKNFISYFGNPSPSVIGSVNTAYTVGGILTGVFLTAPISDRFGRKSAIFLGAFIVIISSFVSTFSPRTIGGFIAGRALTGIGQGFALSTGPVYISEIALSKDRGKIMSFWQVSFGIGSFLAYWINYGCTLHTKSLVEWDWKIVMLLQIIAPTIIITGLLFCPETPRWYVQKDRMDEAVATLNKIRNDPEQVQIELHEINQAIAFERVTNSGRYLPLWKDKSIRKRLLVAFGLNIGQQFTGQGSLVLYSTIIYKKVFTSNSNIQLINALNATLGIVFTLNATWIADRFGRRPLLLIGAAGMSICMFVVAAVETETVTLPSGAKERPVAITTVFLMFLFAFFYKPSWGATVWIWSSEIFPMNVRAQAMGMTSQSQPVASTIISQFFPIFLAKKGFYAMYMFGAIDFVLFVFVWFLVPETKGITLEHMDGLFGGVDHADKGAELIHANEKDLVQVVTEVEEAKDASKTA